MKKLPSLSFLFVLLATNSFAQVSDSERVALIAIYNSTNGDSWRYGYSSIANGTGWLGIKGTECNWYGVTCTSGSVTGLFLTDNLLTGTIPPELGALESLTDLWLNSNSLSGSIPPALGNLAKLENLILSLNSLDGSLPSELGNLENLKQMSINQNNLAGSIPPELGNLKKLLSLYLSSNSLSGNIPKELGGLGELESLGISSNASLTGPIPAELGNLKNLKFLFLYDQNLTGSIPPQLGQLKNLETLSIGGNALTGEIPKALGSLTNIKLFWMAKNSLTGNVPSELGDLSNVQQISLYNNMLTGEIPTELGSLKNLWNLNLSNNFLTGSIPKQLGDLSKLRILNVSGNSLDESIFYFTAFTPPYLSLVGATKSPVVSEVIEKKNDESESTVVADAAAKVVADKAAADKIVADTADKVIADKAGADKIVADAADKVIADKTGTLTSDQLGKLDAGAVASFDKTQIADLDPAAVAGLSADQVKVIDTVAIGGFNKEQISKLSQSAISGLTTDQFDKIAPAALSGLTKDNLGGLGSKVIGNITPEVLSNLNIDAVKGMATEEFSKFITNLDSTKITTDNVDGLLPSGWTIEASGQLKAPPGAKLAFKTLEKVTNINNTSLPTLPDLSKSFSLGGGGNGSILDGLDKAIDSSNIGYNFYQRSDGILNLRAIDASLDLTPAAAFLPDTSEMKQAPKNSVPGIGVDSRGAYVLITDKGYSIPLLPALINPDAVKNLLPVTSEIEIGSGGQTTISDLGDGRGNAVAGVPNPLVSTSIKSAGIYSIGSGAKEKIEIVQADGSLQVISPAFKDQDGLIRALYAIPEVAGVEINTDGTVDLIYNGSSLILKPHFDVEVKEGGGKYLAGIIQDNGKFYFTNAKGERQQFN